MTKKTSPSHAFKSYTDPELITHAKEKLPICQKFLEEQKTLFKKSETRTRGEKIKKMQGQIRVLDKYRNSQQKHLKPKERQNLEKALTVFDNLIEFEEKAKQPKSTVPIVKGKNATQEKYLATLRGDYDLIVAVGVAGTGKTYLAIAAAWEKFKSHQIKKIILTRPAVTTQEDIGFLPGDIREKMDPYLRPMFDALMEVTGKTMDQLSELIEKGQIEIAPLGYMRGRTLNNAVVICDEAQNTTTEQILMFTTRAGKETQVYINGDITQSDLPQGVESGLSYLLDALKKVKDPHITVIHFNPEDVERSRLVKTLVSAYKSLEEERSLAKELSPAPNPPKSVSKQPATVQIMAQNVIVQPQG